MIEQLKICDQPNCVRYKFNWAFDGVFLSIKKVREKAAVVEEVIAPIVIAVPTGPDESGVLVLCPMCKWFNKPDFWSERVANS